jgi:hypothetical protein
MPEHNEHDERLVHRDNEERAAKNRKPPLEDGGDPGDSPGDSGTNQGGGTKQQDSGDNQGVEENS